MLRSPTAFGAVLMRVLMLVATSVQTDTRVLREADALAASGHDVQIVGKDVPSTFSVPQVGVQVRSACAGPGLRPTAWSRGQGRARRVERVVRWLLLPEHRNRSFARWARETALLARTLEFDVVHAHDFTALAVAARLARDRRVPLVYDAHELWTHRQGSGRPTPVQRWRERRTERRLGSDATAVITVGEELALSLRQMFGWSHVRVVRNTFPESSAAELAPYDRPRGAVYAGRIAPHRDLETVAAASRRIDLPISLIGPADRTWSDSFDHGHCSRTDAVGVDEVDQTLRAAGLALITLTGRSGNHRIALPNKLFHAVRAGVPVVASDVGELSRMVRRYDIGVLYRPGDPASLVAALTEAGDRYRELVSNVRLARKELSWSVDRDVLLDLYAGLAP